MRPYFFCFVLLFVLLAACSSKDCSTDSDCAGKVVVGACREASCTAEGLCQSRAKVNCCLDEKGAECKGKEGVMEKYCENGVCMRRVTGGKSEFLNTVTVEIPNKNDPSAKLTLTYNYNSPFDLTKDKVKIFLKPDLLRNDIRDLKLDRVRLLRHYGKKVYEGKYTDSRLEVLNEHVVGQVFWDLTSILEDEMVLRTNVNQTAEEMIVTLHLTLSYEIQKGAEWVHGTFEKEIEITPELLTVYWPEGEVACPVCPASQNQCVMNQCDSRPNSVSNFQCVPRYKDNCCGNRMCESSESKCNCPADCGPAAVEIGELQIGYCQGSLWRTKLKEPAKKVTTSKKFRGGGDAFYWNINVEYKDPMSINDAEVKVSFEIVSVADSYYAGPMVKKIQFKGPGNTLLGEINPTLDVGEGPGSATLKLTNLKDMYTDFYEGKITSPQVIVYFEVAKVDAQGQMDIVSADQTYPLDNIQIVKVTGS